MYDLNKRSYFTTLGELRLLLADYPDDTNIYACGASGCFLHIDDEGSFVSIDYDALGAEYDDWYPIDEDDYTSFWEEQDAQMTVEHEARLAFLATQQKGE